MAFPLSDTFNSSVPSAAEWTEQDAAFFDGVFAPDKENVDPFVPKADICPTDVICIKGGNHAHEGNKHFKTVITEHKGRYDGLKTKVEKGNLAESLWTNLQQQRNTRFLRQTEKDPNLYEILDHERSVRKIWCALRDLKRSNVQQTDRKVRWKNDIVSENDDVLVEIAKLCENKTLLQAMQTSWKDKFDVKKKLFEEQVLHRYDVASERGISPKEFTCRLIGVLLKEIQGIEMCSMQVTA